MNSSKNTLFALSNAYNDMQLIRRPKRCDTHTHTHDANDTPIFHIVCVIKSTPYINILHQHQNVHVRTYIAVHRILLHRIMPHHAQMNDSQHYTECRDACICNEHFFLAVQLNVNILRAFSGYSRKYPYKIAKLVDICTNYKVMSHSYID